MEINITASPNAIPIVAMRTAGRETFSFLVENEYVLL